MVADSNNHGLEIIDRVCPNDKMLLLKLRRGKTPQTGGEIGDTWQNASRVAEAKNANGARAASASSLGTR
eukprot:CAMPEP_0114566238 /NCGR_PEP_ID=MMETSP0114-20121206/14773_1 /TAXON_ID=31324 /ORGANISM="Goniomonas sp, Strain m" /LENGTH=69 /DNA_ID=CAMNT_0001752611 /DNA_START=277 /DNA_END=486 /DNA_ORIENTATION=+